MLHNKVNAHKPFAISYGIQGQYHLSPRIAVTAEIGNMTTMQDFDGYGKAHRLGDHLLSASLGLSVRIGKTGWKRVIDARPYIAQNEWLSAYASSLSDSNSRYHAQHDRDCQTRAAAQDSCHRGTSRQVRPPLFLTMPLLPSQMAILETTTAVSTRCVQE